MILSLIASLLRTAEQCKAKKVVCRVALLRVPRYPTDYVTRAEGNTSFQVAKVPRIVQSVDAPRGDCGRHSGDNSLRSGREHYPLDV